MSATAGSDECTEVEDKAAVLEDKGKGNTGPGSTLSNTKQCGQGTFV